MRMISQLGRWLRRDESRAVSDFSRHSTELVASLLKMAWFVEARDPYTGGHLWRVSRYAELLARAAGFREVDCARASLGGFLHDIGKLGLSDAILRKPGALTKDEMAIVRTHPEIGFRLLAGHPLAHLVSDAVLSHHERPDGPRREEDPDPGEQIIYAITYGDEIVCCFVPPSIP